MPLYALIQSRSERSHRSRIIAGNNILNALFMVVAAGLAMLCLRLGLHDSADLPGHRAASTRWSRSTSTPLVPEFLMRFLVGC